MNKIFEYKKEFLGKLIEYENLVRNQFITDGLEGVKFACHFINGGDFIAEQTSLNGNDLNIIITKKNRQGDTIKFYIPTLHIYVNETDYSSNLDEINGCLNIINNTLNTN